ncbi:uncharacterized protein LOC116775556 [Danaus plexippus]|uniref:uncharacterized protein LOC116775556 n=1 Tax=Danaus plexippus TaxID=13037 RepID=UPI002AB101DE|nr:uncharacterized protein LOC116775556 [Danaus plexippus]
MLALLLLYISRVQPQEITTPASLLGPQHFNYHAYRLTPEDINPTKKGPVLFPNDSPPPPRPPLVVTSRPILESIARSELNPLPQNNSTPETKQTDKAFGESASDSNISNNPYQNFVDVDLIGLNPETQASSYAVPYPDVVRNGFYDYPDINKGYYIKQSTLPPIYKAISDNANRELAKLRQKPSRYNTQENDYDNYDDKQSKEENNYAFSYRVNDHITGDDFSHSQRSSGSATSGEYRVRLPDGRMQIVSYTADENGYKADVRYEDEGQTHKQENNLNFIQNQKQIGYSSKNYYDTSTNYYKHNPKIQQNPYLSDTNDYSDDFQYESNNPHHSKFSIYDPKFSTIRPVTTNELSDSVKYESSTKSVIVSNGDIYTTIKPSLQSLVISPSPIPTLSTIQTQSTIPTLSPSSYLASTIANLRNRIASKPILSKSFIDRINRYITF